MLYKLNKMLLIGGKKMLCQMDKNANFVYWAEVYCCIGCYVVAQFFVALFLQCCIILLYQISKILLGFHNQLFISQCQESFYIYG